MGVVTAMLPLAFMGCLVGVEDTSAENIMEQGDDSKSTLSDGDDDVEWLGTLVLYGDGVRLPERVRVVELVVMEVASDSSKLLQVDGCFVGEPVMLICNLSMDAGAVPWVLLGVKVCSASLIFIFVYLTVWLCWDGLVNFIREIDAVDFDDFDLLWGFDLYCFDGRRVFEFCFDLCGQCTSVATFAFYPISKVRKTAFWFRNGFQDKSIIFEMTGADCLQHY
jgi:hypothetical protein